MPPLDRAIRGLSVLLEPSLGRPEGQWGEVSPGTGVGTPASGSIAATPPRGSARGFPGGSRPTRRDGGLVLGHISMLLTNLSDHVVFRKSDFHALGQRLSNIKKIHR